MSFNKPLQQAVNVAPGSTATLRIPAEDFTLIGIKLDLSGTTFDKTKIDKVKVKVGPRVIWELTYDQLNKVNNYKNDADSLRTLMLDFTERDQAIFPVKEVGGLDLMALLAVGEVFVDIQINAAAVNPKIDATGYFEARQGGAGALVLKHVPFVFATNAAGRFTLPLNLRGALIKRLWLHYTGTNFSASTNGNVNRVEVKKNGIVIFDQTDLSNRFDQGRFKKIPQSNLYVVDFLADNNHDAHVATMRKLSDGSMVYDTFEFNAYIGDAAGSQVTAIAEVLDTPTNL